MSEWDLSSDEVVTEIPIIDDVRNVTFHLSSDSHEIVGERLIMELLVIIR